MRGDQSCSVRKMRMLMLRLTGRCAVELPTSTCLVKVRVRVKG